MKRTHDALEDERLYKRRAVQHIQHLPAHTEPASQIAEHPQSQLMRSITAACVLAGFDSMTASALEMFRAQAEEYMLHFAREVRLSMQGQRRTRPAPHDFSMALSQTDNTKAARVLRPQMMKVKLPKEVSYPSIPEPNPASAAAPDFTSLLRPLIEPHPPGWIPNHFPRLPPQHAWKSTIIKPEREKDARKLREKATEEGMLAEQALRKLAAAAKAGALRADARRREAQQALAGANARESRRPDNDDIFGELLQEVAAKMREDNNGDMPADSKAIDSKLELSEGMLVNAAAVHWRGGKRQNLAF